MVLFFKNYFLKISNEGFTLLEVVVSVAIFSVILVVLVSSFLTMNASNLKTTADRQTLESAQRALEEIIYEIKSSKSIYTPTTTASQLSLETSRYLPAGENDTYIDFFLCGSALCLKKESQNSVALTSDSVKVTNLTFTQISTGANPSVKVDLSVSYSDPTNSGNSSSINLTSTASIRSY